MQPQRLLAITLPPLALIAACSSGQLNQATLERTCDTGEDCATVPFDRPLAAGARTLSPITLASAEGTPALRLKPANIGVASVNGPLIEGVSDGTTAILIENEDGVVLDFVHISVATPTLALLHRASDPAPVNDRITVQPNAALTFNARIFGGAQELTGDADETFTVDNPEFSVDNDEQRHAIVTIPASGSTTVTYTSLGVSASVILEVTP